MHRVQTLTICHVESILVHICCVAVCRLCCLCDPCTERLDEMLAPQEHLTLRSQPTEADYRAATVKQRPTGRRITSAEISVSSHTHTCAETHRCTLSLSLPRTHAHTYTHIHTHSHSEKETYKPQNNISIYTLPHTHIPYILFCIKYVSESFL